MLQPGDKVQIFEDPLGQEGHEGEATIVKVYSVDWFDDLDGLVDLAVKFPGDDGLVVRRRKLVRRTANSYATVGDPRYPLSQFVDG